MKKSRHGLPHNGLWRITRTFKPSWRNGDDTPTAKEDKEQWLEIQRQSRNSLSLGNPLGPLTP